MGQNEIMITVPYKRFKELEDIEKTVLEKKTVLIKKTTEHGLLRVHTYEFLTDDEVVKISSEINNDLHKILVSRKLEIDALNNEILSLNTKIVSLEITKPKRKWYQIL